MQINKRTVIALGAALSISALMVAPAQALLPAGKDGSDAAAPAAAWVPPRDLVQSTKSGDCKSESYAAEIGCLQERIALQKAHLELQKIEAEKRKTETEEMLDVLSGSGAAPSAAGSVSSQASAAPAAAGNDVTVNRIVGFDSDMSAIITYNNNRMSVRAGDVIDHRLSVTSIRSGAVHLVLDGVAHVMGAGVSVSAGNPAVPPGMIPSAPMGF